MRKFRFYKEKTGKWYIDLPKYKGPKADLQMVAGADTMLDIVSNSGTDTSLILAEELFEGAEQLNRIKERKSAEGGGDYILKTYAGEQINHGMWLCEVVKYIFRRLPVVIYFKRTV